MVRNILILITLSFLFTTNCTTSPLRNVGDTPIAEKKSQKDVAKAIKQALKTKGWTVVETKPNEIIAAIKIKTHSAKISIPYSKSSYSIKHLESANLRFDGRNIHRRYNNWIQKLDRLIKKNLL